MHTTDDPTQVIPPQFEMNVDESWTLTFDTTPLLDLGQSLSDVSVVVTRIPDGKVITPASDPTITGNILSQHLSGPTDLGDAGLFRVRLTFTIQPIGDPRVLTLTVEVTR